MLFRLDGHCVASKTLARFDEVISIALSPKKPRTLPCYVLYMGACDDRLVNSASLLT